MVSHPQIPRAQKADDESNCSPTKALVCGHVSLGLQIRSPNTSTQQADVKWLVKRIFYNHRTSFTSSSSAYSSTFCNLHSTPSLHTGSPNKISNDLHVAWSNGPLCSPSHTTLTSHFHSGAASFLKHFLLASDLSFIGFSPLPLWSHLLLTATLLLFATKIQCWLLVQSFSLFSLCVLLISNFFLLHSFNHHLPTQRNPPELQNHLFTGRLNCTSNSTQPKIKSWSSLPIPVPFQGFLSQDGLANC